ncbi:TlpA disulfide reductase family protein [Nocardioides panacisoli]|uniref:Thioredoxin domain-containing protein n=1 Tax=Nocardioides panacisoli TaxID=627624 RepID=A0ABP7IE13_9ACTN
MSRFPFVVVVLAVAVLLAGCSKEDTSAGCDVDVASAQLRQQAHAAGLPGCATVEGGDTDLPDVSLPCLGSDGAATLAGVKGPAIVNFWSSSCGPCVKEMPALAAFDKEYGDQVAVLGVDFLDTYPGAAIDLAGHSKVRYPSLADACGALQDTDLVIQGLPQFVFVKADGAVEQAAGGVDSVDALVGLVEKNLGITLERSGS